MRVIKRMRHLTRGYIHHGLGLNSVSLLYCLWPFPEFNQFTICLSCIARNSVEVGSFSVNNSKIIICEFCHLNSNSYNLPLSKFLIIIVIINIVQFHISHHSAYILARIPSRYTPTTRSLKVNRFSYKVSLLCY